MARYRRSSGFTLVELLVVVAMLGILAAIATPNLKSLITTVRVNAAIREIASDMMWAKMKAVADNNDYWVTFDGTNNSYSIYDDNDNDGTLVSGELVKTIVIPNEHTGIEYGYIAGTKNTSGDDITSEITFSGDKVRFYSRGTANKNGALYLIPTEDLSTSYKNRMRAITVIQTGRIKVYRYDDSEDPPWK